jgi:hypothetical protein
VRWRSWAQDDQRNLTRSLRSNESGSTNEQMTKYCASTKQHCPYVFDSRMPCHTRLEPRSLYVHAV